MSEDRTLGAPGKTCSITFFYYADIDLVAPFYEEVLDFKLVLDQGMARIYRIIDRCYFGIVDGNRGHLRHGETRAAMLTMVVDDVNAWHARVKDAGVTGLSDILRGMYCEHFFFADPAGYAIEIQRFHSPEIMELFSNVVAG